MNFTKIFALNFCFFFKTTPIDSRHIPMKCGKTGFLEIAESIQLYIYQPSESQQEIQLKQEIHLLAGL
jgi:hypothetical protein